MSRDYPDLISVIVPVYKVEQYLDQCIKSIVDQTHRNLEIILVDDGSPDNCPALCDRWAQMDRRIKVIHKENGGLSDARNAGLEAAAGKYIGFVDSDDWIDSSMYQKLLSAICRDQSDISCCAVMKVFDDGKRVPLTHCGPCVLDKVSGEIELINEGKLLNPVWYKLYAGSVLDSIRFEKGKLHEDVFFTYRAVGKAERISIIDDTFYYYRQRKDSIMGTSYSLRRLDSLEAMERRLHYFQTFIPEAAEAALVNLWLSCVYHGQMALKYLNKADQRHAVSCLEGILNRNPITAEIVRKLPLKRKIWIQTARVSFRGACLLRNLADIGF